jgi:excinuclease ABC subunit C
VRIKISVNEEWPRLSITRRLLNDGAMYFGPYSSAQAIRTTLKAVSRVFPVRRCKETVFRNRVRPCVYHQIGLCTGPCAKKISKQVYDEMVADLIPFSRARTGPWSTA